MHLYPLICTLLLSSLLAACGGVEIQSTPVDQFANGHYTYYKWRTEPLPQNTGSKDPFYELDPIVRREVNANLQALGYKLDPARAQFSVDYLYAPGLIQGAKPDQASNISHIPSATINRQVDQASVDNAIALGGVKSTNNMVLQFNDAQRQEVIWTARMTKIVENANKDVARIEENLAAYIARILADLPAANAAQK